MDLLHFLCLSDIIKSYMFELFTKISERDARNISPVTLAFVGDAVYSLFVREKLVLSSDFSTGELQKLTSKKVSAHGQNALLARVESVFTEEELAVFKRGRNAKKPTRSKNASVEEYNNSTGLEAVIGYLYLTGNYARISELLENGEL